MSDERQGMGAGILMITIGLLFLADRAGFGSFGHLWPLILIVLGAVSLLFPREVSVVAGRRGVSRRYRGRSSGGVWLLLVGVLALLNENHIFRFRDSWPLFIVVGGLLIMLGGMRRRPISSEDQPIDRPDGGGIGHD